MTALLRAACAAALLAGCRRDQIGAPTGRAAPHPYFTVTRSGGADWFAAPPDGRRFLSLGVNVVKPDDAAPNPSSSVYRGSAARGGEGAWLDVTASRMRKWGLNTVGSWSHPPAAARAPARTGQLHLAPWSPHRLVDVWDPAYAAAVDRAAEEQMRPGDLADPKLIGWFLENELPWYGEAGWPTSDPRTLRDRYLALTRTAPGRAVAERMESADEFAGEVARRFMAVAVAAVRRRDPHHLILGVRFAGGAPGPVARAVGEATDVLSFNWYVKDGRPDPAYLDRIWESARKPILISEFSYRAMENRSGCGNTHGADATVGTQAERAVRYRRFVETLARLPYVVGFHWFMWFDQPTLGRSDGEDSNYGLVDHRDEPYGPITEAMREVNPRLERLHAGSGWRYPGEDGPPHLRPPLPVAGSGRAFRGLVWRDWTKGTEEPDGTTWGDPASECGTVLTRTAGGCALAVHAGSGWGCGASFPAPGGVSADAAGATALVIAFETPAGLAFDAILTESGSGPPSATGFLGARDADGEEYALALRAPGGATTIAAPLSSFTLAGGYGNQTGNGRMDAAALDRCSVRVHGGQGEVRIVISRIELR